MLVINKIEEVKVVVNEWRQKGLSIGFVPTMGALHQGHLTLVKQAVKENDKVIVSVFVNPVQFNNPRDLETYPRTLDADVAMLQEVDCDMVFAPTAKEMYPTAESTSANYDLGGLDEVMEGAYRPGHFQGVVLVVDKLLRITQPYKAYFGKKDYQQLVIIKHMVATLGLPIQIVPVPIVREADGLAMSSRNRRLTEVQRQVAPTIFKSLEWIKTHCQAKTVTELEQAAVKQLETAGFKVDYVSIVDRLSLQTLSPEQKPVHAVVCVAAYLGEVRLIDNMELGS